MATTAPATRAMTVGQLSRRTGTSIKALREYTDLGLIYSLGRSPGNYRLYTDDALQCVRVIDQLRALGLTIAEIRELIMKHDATGAAAGARLAELLARSRERARRAIAAAQHTLTRIDAFEAGHVADLARDHLPWAGDAGACRRA